MVQRWSQALAKREAARRRIEQAQEEFSDFENDIIEIVGPETYNHFFDMYTRALTATIRAHYDSCLLASYQSASQRHSVQSVSL
jgi:hypothetical protein